jgi:pyridoxamine 5'-phosphate oxidase
MIPFESINEKLAAIRSEYHGKELNEKDVSPDPFIQFESWMNDAISGGADLANAMHLSTSGPGNKPSGRIVLLRGFDYRGFVFYTDYNSRKGREISENSNAALTFFWSDLFRSVRIEGKVFRLPAAESDSYFDSRPAESRISALASCQSQVVGSRDILEAEAKELEQKTHGKTLKRPAGWGGYYLSPDYFEFWQGREHRLHDRISYTKIKKSNSWKIERLYP